MATSTWADLIESRRALTRRAEEAEAAAKGYAYNLDQFRKQAEAAEARLALLERVGARLADEISAENDHSEQVLAALSAWREAERA